MNACDQKTEERRSTESEISLLIRRCQSCRKLAAAPVTACLDCHSHDLESVPSAGAGDVVSWRIHQQPVKGQAHTIPVVLAIVALDDGPWIYAAIDTAEPESLDNRRRVRFQGTSTSGEFPVFAVAPEHLGRLTKMPRPFTRAVALRARAATPPVAEFA